ncbi:uncharacterized protein si:ch211-269k10.4 [Melanotaenia boesemani]|uniref:uncharacterized protein si:ch211-269k10.4 n=1 Tax=Melanotaenia boesemani TaxID=1250792 RepID=UPI001C0518D9|nr:uncharacterized protein si:ch211-269k10.4 [Melanotaenia boesemani]
MACADIEMDILDDEFPPAVGRREPPPPPLLIHCYQASEMMPAAKRPLHNLLQKQPAVLGSLQVMSGLLSVGVGIVFAVTQPIQGSLLNLFRVSQLTGVLYIIAGLVSNLLFKFPALLTVSLGINCGCIILAVVAACLISVDLARGWASASGPNEYIKMELLELCVLGLEIFLSVVLCFWFTKEKRSKLP